MDDGFPELHRGNRRSFFQTSGAALGAAGFASLSSVSDCSAAGLWSSNGHARIARNDTLLFQGDSITDAGRNRQKAPRPNDQSTLGSGYAWVAAVEVLVSRRNDGLRIYNRGISGDKVFQLANRWQADCLDLKPNLLSILIGVNDFWHTFKHNYQGTAETYERDYRVLLKRTLKALPRIKLVICEPFVLRCGVVDEKWFPAFDAYRASAERVAKAYDATFIPFQSIFDEAVKYAPAAQWLQDGVHPTPDGASLMAHNWLKAVDG